MRLNRNNASAVAGARGARTRVSICVCARSFVGVMWLLDAAVVVNVVVLIRALASAVDLCAIVSGTQQQQQRAKEMERQKRHA